MNQSLKSLYWWLGKKKMWSIFRELLDVFPSEIKPPETLCGIIVATQPYEEMGRDNYGFCHEATTYYALHDSNWVLVNRLTKSARFVPIKESFSIDRLVGVYIKEVMRYVIGFKRLKTIFFL